MITVREVYFHFVKFCALSSDFSLTKYFSISRFKGGERERERERQTDRQAERERERQRERDRGGL